MHDVDVDWMHMHMRGNHYNKRCIFDCLGPDVILEYAVLQLNPMDAAP